jgi:hypothetical protein
MSIVSPECRSEVLGTRMNHYDGERQLCAGCDRLDASLSAARQRLLSGTSTGPPGRVAVSASVQSGSGEAKVLSAKILQNFDKLLCSSARSCFSLSSSSSSSAHSIVDVYTVQSVFCHSHLSRYVFSDSPRAHSTPLAARSCRPRNCYPNSFPIRDKTSRARTRKSGERRESERDERASKRKL